MSENNDRILENQAEETAAVETAVEEAAQEAQAGAAQETAAEKKEDKPKKKKRKGSRVALPIVAVLLVIALLFGAVVGYILGRSTASETLRDTQQQLDALTEAFEEVSGMPVYDAFTEELTEENKAALSDLSGEQADDGVNTLLGEDVLLGQVLEGEADEPVVVAEYKGGVLMSDEVAREYEEQMTALVFAGYSEEDIAETVLAEVMQYMVGDRVMEAKAREMGLYDLSAEDRAAIDAEAEAIYADQIDFYRDYVNTDGMTGEEATGAVKSYLQENEGITLDILRSELESGWWMEKLFAELTKDVSVTEEDLQHSYEHMLAEQKEGFSAYVDEYEYAQMNGETILYNLDGYRAVRLLALGFENMEQYEAVLALSDELLELDPEKDAEMIAGYTAEIEACYAGIEAEAAELAAQIQAGADFEDLLAAHGDDEGMKDAVLRESGYHVSRNSLLWPGEIIDAAFALQNPGDISAPVRTGEGVCILQYVGDVPAGPVALEDVKDALQEQVLESARFAAYEQQLNAWLEEAGAVYYPERMQ